MKLNIYQGKQISKLNNKVYQVKIIISVKEVKIKQGGRVAETSDKASRKNLMEEVTFIKTQRKWRSKPCCYLEESILGRGNSQCKGPEVGACHLCSENTAETSTARAEATWGRIVNVMLLLVMKQKSAYYHCCTSNKAVSSYSSFLCTPHSWHLSLKSTEIGGWVLSLGQEGSNL